MSGPNPLHVPAANQLGRLLQCQPALLDTTMDQLRTLLAVREARSALRAARMLGREQSSVQKQIDTLNRNFRELCGESLVVKQGRGKDVYFTPTGEALAELAHRTLGNWLNEIHECGRRLGTTLTVGTTRFMLDSLAAAWDEVSAEFRRREVELKVVHIRTKDTWSKLDAKQVDLVCGSVVTSSDSDARLDSYDVIEWRRGGLAVITNLSERELPGGHVTVEQLPALPLVVPSEGLIADFLRGWYGSDYRNRLEITAEIDEIQYGLSLLRSRLMSGCMIVTTGLGRSIAAGGLPEANGLRAMELRNETAPRLERLVGVFARRGERSAYAANHPLNLLWDAFQAQASVVPGANAG
ncbi:LysR family transcriptional regulator [Solihabitans fulvus]|uniref:LysR family transcriptional regulator n=1 Tax=Solihabitans fulvus TaxID=1892852 RepID=A0A5B2XPF9_9PSEU|nr:LysR family transcriptional regulator [Solihabitans fulvus]KAA2264781.1 LysR family transcriptional regulator [Solihabitans fulvus]